MCRVFLRVVAIESVEAAQMKRFPYKTLRHLRNDIPIRQVIERLLQIPSKEIEGVYKFICPDCSEFTSSINPNANLARCHRCKKNFNPIELVMAETNQSFVQSVKMLLEKESLLSKAPPVQPAVSRERTLRRIEIPAQLSCLLNNSSCND